MNGDEEITQRILEVNLLERGSLEDQEGNERINDLECYENKF